MLQGKLPQGPSKNTYLCHSHRELQKLYWGGLGDWFLLKMQFPYLKKKKSNLNGAVKAELQIKGESDEFRAMCSLQNLLGLYHSEGSKWGDSTRPLSTLDVMQMMHFMSWNHGSQRSACKPRWCGGTEQSSSGCDEGCRLSPGKLDCEPSLQSAAASSLGSCTVLVWCEVV